MSQVFCTVSIVTTSADVSSVVPIREVRNRTEQRIASVLRVLQEAPGVAFSYQDLIPLTGMPYDTLLYVLHTLAEVGIVRKTETPSGPGRPRVTFQWAWTRADGARRSA